MADPYQAVLVCQQVINPVTPQITVVFHGGLIGDDAGLSGRKTVAAQSVAGQCDEKTLARPFDDLGNVLVAEVGNEVESFRLRIQSEQSAVVAPYPQISRLVLADASRVFGQLESADNFLVIRQSEERTVLIPYP